ncbi:GyrI-like domain-containing protein [Proteiniclasticum sp. QWL-01]|uniref:GyrI-like domain-containing protein n=1 Tax=Proteiniclasticum sp. QWL-01 TaxID=3036945 RepID=UPI00220CAC5A|nr:GyrI-like domain-containing protein [Proteiniclasticum sp. QWL-01]UUM12612.1 GyrI-like domain-containing protein [Clostridiaceae bacterium HFYG-1003]WFF74167.1 GyrI-like domain-containing protein [Proteiniclasticum sp. QWL-01]
MNTQLIQKPAFAVAGLSMTGIAGADFPGLWTRLMGEIPFPDLLQLGSGESFGVCYDYQPDDTFRYMAGFDVKDRARASELGLEILDIAPAQYLVVELIGPMPESIHRGWQWLMTEYFPSSPFTHAGTPDFEAYLEGDMSATDYKMELWVPVREK